MIVKVLLQNFSNNKIFFMKFIRGNAIEVAQESISSLMLLEAGIANPDYIPTIMRAYKENAPLNYILDVKGMKSRNVNLEQPNSHKYRAVSSNHVKYRLDEDDIEIRHFRSDHRGVTFECPAYPSQPGYRQSIIYGYTDSNWDGFQEVIELNDNYTYLYNLTDPEEIADGVWKHTYKLVTKDPEEYVFDPSVMFEEGAEYRVKYNMHEQDFSERGVEKYSFKGWSDAYLTLQRFKYSWSGTAKAMMKNAKVSVHVVENNGKMLYLTEADNLMMRRMAEQHNAQMIFGKQTVSADTGKVILKNMKGRDVMSGSGILFSNDGPVYLPLNGWTKKYLDWLITEIDRYINVSSDGYREIVALMAPQSYISFQTLMRDLGVTQNNNIEGTGANKGFIDTYAFYELAGIRIIAMKEPSMINRPRRMELDGSYSNDWDTILLPLGKTVSGNNGVELIQLRPMSKGTVAGIDEGGNIASSVDGSSTHALIQNGIINQNKVFMLRKPQLIYR